MKKKISAQALRSRTGWLFLLPATLMIVWMSFYPMVRALILSFQTGVGQNMTWAGLTNYIRLFQDPVLKQAILNTLVYLVVEVPIMLFFALILASMLNSPTLKLKGFYRTAIFLPCATSLVSTSVIFRSLFALDGIINHALVGLGILETGYNWLGNPVTAKVVIILALLWRWTGYNMIFYLAGLQSIDKSMYEAARIDGAGAFTQLTRITIPMLKPIILLTAVLSTNGNLQIFDESFNLTSGGPGNATISISHYLYKVSFEYSPNFGYATAISYLVFVMVAVLALVQMKVGDKR